MADSQPDEKAVYALVSAVETNMDRLRRILDGLRQIHNHWKGDNKISINLIAQIAALKSNLGQMQHWLEYALADLHPQLLSDLSLLMTSCGVLAQYLDALINRLRRSDHDSLNWATRLKYAIGSKSMSRLRTVAQGQTDALSLLLAACKW